MPSTTEMIAAVHELAGRRHWTVSHQHGFWYAYNSFRVIGVDLEVRLRPLDESAQNWWLEVRPSGDDAFLNYSANLTGCLQENVRIERAAAEVRELPNLRGAELERTLAGLDKRGLGIARAAFGIYARTDTALRRVIQRRIEGK